MPHLHIEFRLKGSTVNAFTGTCGPSFTHWAAPDPYQETFRLIASGTNNQVLNLDLVKDPPPQVDTLATSDASVSVWVQLHNVRAGSVSRFELYDPAGLLFSSGEVLHDVFFSMSWWFIWNTVSGSMTQPGTWRYDYYNDGSLLVSRPFELVPAMASPVQPPQRGGPQSGIGGGGLR